MPKGKPQPPPPSPERPEELETIWDDSVAQAFAALRPKQQAFLLHYLREGNGAEAYRRAYNPLAKDHLASVCASQLLASPSIRAVMAKFEDRKADFLFRVVHTYSEMLQATKPNWVEKDGTYENTGETPDWKARKDAAEGLAKIYGLNAPDEVKHEVTGKVSVIELPKKDQT